MDFEELICGVCEQHFDNDQHLPRMVPRCGHTFCTQCIADIINATSNPSEHLFCCPEDRIIIRLRNSDVACFPINFLLASLVGKKAHLTTNKIHKTTTKEDYPQSDKRRNSSFGLSTTGSHGDGNGDMSLHSTKNNFFAAENGAGNYCLEHAKVLEIVCVDDQCRVCSSCALFGSHKNHNIRPEGEVLKEVANRAESIIDLYQTIQKQEKSLADDQNMKDIQKRLNERQNELTRMIQEKFLEFINMLKVQERRLVEELDHKFSGIKENVAKKNQVSHDLIERVKSWKVNAEEALTIMSEKSEKGDIAFELLEDRRNTKNDIIILGDKLTHELKKTKETTSKSYEGDEMLISVTFNESFSKILDLLCQVTCSSELGSDSYSKQFPENLSMQKLPIFGKVEKSLNSSRNNIKVPVPEINLFRRTPEGSEDNFVRNKENNTYIQESRLASPTANFGTPLDYRRSEHDTDLLDFELKDLNIAELAESDHVARFAQPKIQEFENNENARLRSFRKKDRENEDYEAFGALNNLTNRSTSSRPATERKSKQHCSRKDEEAYASLSRDTSRVIRRSVSPLKRDNSYEKIPKSSRSRRNKEIQVSEKYEPIVEGIMYNIVDTADLTGADLGDIGVCKLADFLRSNTKLRSLKLLRNKITDEGGIALANALVHNRTLQTVNLTQNLLTEKTVDAFLELIKTHKNIKTIYFNQNSISLRNVRAKIKEIGAMGVSVNI